MRIILQRCLSASVTVNDQKVSEIQKGIVCLIGIAKKDTKELLKYWGEKIVKIKLWKDQNDKSWSSSVADNNYELLLVSQFTLNATLQGNKPDFRQSMDADEARIMFEYFVKVVEESYQKDKVKTGVFQNYMQVGLINDGPVTINIDDDGLTNQQVIKAIHKNNKSNTYLSKKNHNINHQTNQQPLKKEEEDLNILQKQHY